MSGLRRSIGLGQGIALYVGAILGPGLLALPAVAAETAGPASLVAWVALALLSLPISLTFAALARAYPQAGGFAGYTEQAFGPLFGAITGWLFFFCIPSGCVIVALIAGQYGAAAFGLLTLCGTGRCAGLPGPFGFSWRSPPRLNCVVCTSTIHSTDGSRNFEAADHLRPT